MKNIPFEHQLCALRPKFKNFAFSLTQNLDDAEDLIQDTLFKAIRYSRLLKEGTNLKG